MLIYYIKGVFFTNLPELENGNSFWKKINSWFIVGLLVATTAIVADIVSQNFNSESFSVLIPSWGRS